MTGPLLSKHNDLVALDSGVWVKADESERAFIDYSDGDSIEDRVYAQVDAALDRSVFSEALDHPWDEWALEYHLGSKRSNIYRGLNLSGVKTVLEVGCGCGAITRYLGEQGFSVDAVEGSLRRAQIARLRTEDLENVQIVSSNYHDLSLGKNSYDLVIFTGVLEYSGAYAPEGVAPETQLKLTLKHAQAALSQQGQILIAIENRTGFKYLAGAGEDHLSVANIGLLNYAEPKSKAITRGIRTWSKQQWKEMIEALGFSAHEFCYPFPDYKVPDAILSEHFLNNSSHPEQVLGGITSRDYLKDWQPQISESTFWRTAAQTGTMDEFANSFLIVLGASKLQLKKTIDFDFVRFASVKRKPVYRLQLSKSQQSKAVHRSALMVDATSDKDGPFMHTLIESEAYIDGEVLEQQWRQALSVVPSYQELAAHLQAYAEWLDSKLAEGVRNDVDILPQNIIVDENGHWHLIDQEWRAGEPLSKEIILFRALMYFAINARDLLADLELNASHHTMGFKSSGIDAPLIETIEDFVRWGFECTKMDYQASRVACLAFETKFQQQLCQAVFNTDLKAVLSTPIYQGRAAHAVTLPQGPLEIRAYWTQVEDIWHPDHSVAGNVMIEQGLGARLDLPEMIARHRYLRIDPGANVLHLHRAWLEFNGLSIIVQRKDGSQSSIFNINTASDLFKRVKSKGLRLLSGDRLVVTDMEAYFVLDLSSLEWGDDIQSIYLDVDFDISLDDNIATARQLLRTESTNLVNRIRHRQNILNRYQERIVLAGDTLQHLEQRIANTRSADVGQNYFNRIMNKFGLKGKRLEP